MEEMFMLTQFVEISAHSALVASQGITAQEDDKEKQSMAGQ